MARRLFVLMFGVLVAVPLLGGCSSGVAAGDWAGRVCDALTPWRQQITQLNAQAQQQLATATTPEQARTSLLALLEGARAASEQARVAVEAAGVPDVTGGTEVARRFIASLAAVRDAYARARHDLAALSSADAKAFYDGVAAVLRRLNQDYAASALDTSSLDSPALKQAFDEAPQCR